MSISAPSGSPEQMNLFVEKVLQENQPLHLFCQTTGEKVVDLGTFTVLMHNDALRLVYQEPDTMSGEKGKKYAVATLSRDKTVLLGRQPSTPETSSDVTPITLSAATPSEQAWVHGVSRVQISVTVKNGVATVTNKGSNGTLEGNEMNPKNRVVPHVEVLAMELSKPKSTTIAPGSTAAGWFKRTFGGR